MKYLVSWSVRLNGTAEENEQSGKRNLAVFGKWTPAAPSQLMLARLDGQGGFGIVDTDDPTALLRDIAIFTADLEFTVYPVIELDQAVPVFQQALEFRSSA